MPGNSGNGRSTYVDRLHESIEFASESDREPTHASSSFPGLLYFILKAAEDNNTSHIISWQSHGRTFVVHDKDAFVKEVMSMYFNSSRFVSFQKQLNVYGFTRVTSGPDRGGWYHEYFLRGRPDLLTKVKRVAVKNKKSSAKESEIDFYAMIFCPEISSSSAGSDTTTNGNEKSDVSCGKHFPSYDEGHNSGDQSSQGITATTASSTTGSGSGGMSSATASGSGGMSDRSSSGAVSSGESIIHTRRLDVEDRPRKRQRYSSRASPPPARDCPSSQTASSQYTPTTIRTSSKVRKLPGSSSDDSKNGSISSDDVLPESSSSDERLSSSSSDEKPTSGSSSDEKPTSGSSSDEKPPSSTASSDEEELNETSSSDGKGSDSSSSGRVEGSEAGDEANDSASDDRQRDEKGVDNMSSSDESVEEQPTSTTNHPKPPNNNNNNTSNQRSASQKHLWH